MQPSTKTGLLVEANSMVSQAELDSIIRRDESIDKTYEVEKECFARGKFAQVRRVRHKQTSKVYAAKTIRKRRTRCPNATVEIMHEIRVLLTMKDCPYIVHLKEVFETKTEFILILELAEGGELQRILDDEECIPEDVCRRIMWQIVHGIRQLHSHSIAHLDLKNILLTSSLPTGSVKLCDFGISRLITDTTEIREIMGTVDYMPPEVLHYEPISLASDMWSVGVVAYVLLSGYTPFGDEDQVRTYSNITSSELEFPTKLFDSVSAQAKNFIELLLNRVPSERMTSVECLEHEWLKPLTDALARPTNGIGEFGDQEKEEIEDQNTREPVENGNCDKEDCAKSKDVADLGKEEDNEKENIIIPLEKSVQPNNILVECSTTTAPQPKTQKRHSSDIYAEGPRLTAFISNESLNKKSDAIAQLKTTGSTTTMPDNIDQLSTPSCLLVDEVFEATTTTTTTATAIMAAENIVHTSPSSDIIDPSPSPPMTPNKKFYLSIEEDESSGFNFLHHRASTLSLTPMPRRGSQRSEQEVSVSDGRTNTTTTVSIKSHLQPQQQQQRSLSMERLNVEHRHKRFISETSIITATSYKTVNLFSHQQQVTKITSTSADEEPKGELSDLLSERNKIEKNYLSAYSPVKLQSAS